MCVVLLEGILNKFIVHGNLLHVTNGYFEVYLLKSLALTVVIEAWERKRKKEKGFHSICLKKRTVFWLLSATERMIIKLVLGQNNLDIQQVQMPDMNIFNILTICLDCAGV